jgi:hypothetical protein
MPTKYVVLIWVRGLHFEVELKNENAKPPIGGKVSIRFDRY